MIRNEIKNIIKNLAPADLEQQKTRLMHLLKLQDLQMNDNYEDITPRLLEKIEEQIAEKERLSELFDLRQKEMLLLCKLEEQIDIFIDDLTFNGYEGDAVELIMDSMRQLGGYAEIVRNFLKNRRNLEYFQTDADLTDLLAMLYKRIRFITEQNKDSALFTVLGLVNGMRFYLEEKCKEHGKIILSILGSEGKNQDNLTLEEKQIMSRAYGDELQRRIYLWDKLTLEFKDSYSLSQYFIKEL